MPESFCSTLVSNYSTFLKPKILELEKTLLYINQIFNDIDINTPAFSIDPDYSEQITWNISESETCLSNSFTLKNCQTLCSNYSLSNFSDFFVSNLKLH